MPVERDHERIRALCASALLRSPQKIQAIPAGLGARRFYRLTFTGVDPVSMMARIEDTEAHSPPGSIGPAGISGNLHRIAQKTPPTWLPEPSLEPIRSFLEHGGLPVPKSFARDPELGIELLEDVGKRTLMAARGPSRLRLYTRACGFIPKLQALNATPEAIPAFGRVYGRSLIESKFWKFEHWAIPGLLDREANAEEREAIAEAVERIAEVMDEAPRRLSHRDYKAENLHWTPEPQDPYGIGSNDTDGRLVMIDVQGAFMAPPEYDLVCLLYDLQVRLDEVQIGAHFEQTCPLLPDSPSPTEAALRFDLLAVARLCKDVSHIVEAGLVRKDRRRWREIPRGLALLGRAAGRQEHTFPCLRALTYVIPALTAAARSSDSADRSA